MKLTAGVAYRVTSSRYAASDPASASLASSASLAVCPTDIDYTVMAAAWFQAAAGLAGGRWMADGGWWMVDGGWWMVVSSGCGWWLVGVGGSRWLVAGQQRPG